MRILALAFGLLAVLCSCQSGPAPDPSPEPSPAPSVAPSPTAVPLPSNSPLPTASAIPEPSSSPVPTAEPSPIPLPPIEHLTPDALDAIYLQAQNDWITYQVIAARPLAMAGPSGETFRASDRDPAAMAKLKGEIVARFGQYEASFGKEAVLVGKLGRASAIRATLEGKGERALDILKEMVEKEKAGTVEEGAVNWRIIQSAAYAAVSKPMEAINVLNGPVASNPREEGIDPVTPYTRKQLEAAVAWIDHELSVAADGTLLARRGMIRQVLGDVGGARADFERGMAVGSGDCRERNCLLDVAQGDRAGALEKVRGFEGSENAERRAILQAAIAGCGPADKIDPLVFLATSRKAVEAAPRDPFALLLRGRARMLMDDRDGAQRDATDALKVNQSFPQAYELRTRVKISLKDSLGAQNDIRSCKQIRKGYLAVYVLGCEVLYNDARESDLLVEAEEAVKLFPKSAELLVYKGKAYLMKKEPVEAEKSAADALVLAPGNPEALAVHGIALALTDKADAGWKDLDAAAADGAASYGVFALRGRAFELAGKPDDATKEFKKAEQAIPKWYKAGYRTALGKMNRADK